MHSLEYHLSLVPDVYVYKTEVQTKGSYFIQHY